MGSQDVSYNDRGCVESKRLLSLFVGVAQQKKKQQHWWLFLKEGRVKWIADVGAWPLCKNVHEGWWWCHIEGGVLSFTEEVIGRLPNTCKWVDSEGRVEESLLTKRFDKRGRSKRQQRCHDAGDKIACVALHQGGPWTTVSR